MLSDLKQLLTMRGPDINSWFESQWKGLKPHFYLSCDIRHSGFKIAPVDTNLFPAGFNNLCNTFSKELTRALAAHFVEFHPGAENILVYAEEHTRNKFYLKNLVSLGHALEEAGKRVVFGVLGSELPHSPYLVDLETGKLALNRLERRGDVVTCGSFVPDIVISNNDFSSGVPEILQKIGQPLVPSPSMGWHCRRKEEHFSRLKIVAENFGENFKFDPWLLYPVTESEAGVDLNDDKSLQKLAQDVENVLRVIAKKYEEHDLRETPYVYLKNNRGTYGIGLLPVFSGEEVLTLSRRKKNKLLSSKGSVAVTDFLVQEGIPTADFYSGYPIEPVIYAVGRNPVGGFFRIHESKNALESLNAPGMTFSCLCLHKLSEPHENIFLDCRQKEDVVELARFVTRLASLAAARELL